MGREALNLLVVDDEEQVGRVVARCLRKQWHRITVVRTVEDGMRELGTGEYDVVLSDLDCPGINSGLAVVHGSRIPVVVYTGREGASADGAPVFYKPVDMELLSDELLRVWEERQEITI
jgi:DNA-binding NtrC family response regulator